MLSRSWWLLLLPLCLGCDVSGNGQDYPGAQRFEPPDRDFRFFYLEPPWRPASAPEGKLLYLVVDALDGQQASDDKVSHKLWVSYESDTDPSSAAARIGAEHQAAGRTLTREPGEIRSLAGATGWEVQAVKGVDESRSYNRDACFTATSGRVVRFALMSAYPLDEQQIDDLLLSFANGTARERTP